MSSRKTPIAVGERAPDFTLPDHEGKPVTLASLLEKGPVVLYFYPKDETLGCTREACEFRDQHARFIAASASVVGVSDDGAESHRAFREHHGLPFTLLSDRGGEVRARYGVRKTLGLLPGRATFVIDRSGIVRHVFVSQVRALQHVHEALASLDAIERAPEARG